MLHVTAEMTAVMHYINYLNGDVVKRLTKTQENVNSVLKEVKQLVHGVGCRPNPVAQQPPNGMRDFEVSC